MKDGAAQNCEEGQGSSAHQRETRGKSLKVPMPHLLQNKRAALFSSGTAMPRSQKKHNLNRRFCCYFRETLSKNVLLVLRLLG